MSEFALKVLAPRVELPSIAKEHSKLVASCDYFDLMRKGDLDWHAYELVVEHHGPGVEFVLGDEEGVVLGGGD